MKKLIFLVSALVFITSCTNEDLVTPTPIEEVKKELKVVGNVGIKVETPFVKEEVSMNVKAETAGKYSVKILNIVNTPVSSEEVELKAGNNILKIYAKVLPSSAYRIGLFDLNGNLLGIGDFNKL